MLETGRTVHSSEEDMFGWDCVTRFNDTSLGESHTNISPQNQVNYYFYHFFRAINCFLL